VRQPHTTDDWRLHVFVFGAFRPLRLAATSRRTAGTSECTGSTAALARPAGTAATTRTATEATAASSGWGTDAAATATTTAAAVVTAATAAGATA
jgi:hypothetical protein